MENDFKVGDKVRIKLTPKDGVYFKFNGEVGIIDRIYPGNKYKYRVEMETDTIMLREEEINLLSISNPNSKIRIRI